ncbi:MULTISPECIES: nucleotidyltransferase family protein [Thermococcus]|uniref:protein adenylyltransferase n=1 Tax=Thermococcus barossii TaxID=54077 RepID=A0A2Z2MJ95_9EURY|nr:MULTISPECIES: nucleotidyltransferase family protein [Thermococcus]ASJ05803.1 nucleotidyltransferase [Thermococcus barossii]NJE76411.1 nucleotidyltransferase [Thermococcus sp. ES12]
MESHNELEQILSVLHAHAQELRKFGVRHLWLFGSYVRGDARKDSDLDVLVEFEPGKKSFDSYMELKFFLEELLGVEVDLITVEALKPKVKEYVWREAVSVEGL